MFILCVRLKYFERNCPRHNEQIVRERTTYLRELRMLKIVKLNKEYHIGLVTLCLILVTC